MTMKNLSANPMIRALIKDLAKFPSKFNSTLHEDDEMFWHGVKLLDGDQNRSLGRYFGIGKRLLDSVKQIVEWQFKDWKNLDSFLDFACGYGRFTRFLIEEIPPHKIWVSDIYPNAVNFQKEQFGVKGFVSVYDPKDLVIEEKFDCILASSFLTHIPESKFVNWLEKLYSLLSDRGVLIISVLDMEFLDPGVESDGKGLVFFPYSESKYLDGENYGTTYVNGEFMRSTLEKVIPSSAKYHCIKKGLNGHLDIYLIVNNPHHNFAKLNFKHHPIGALETCEIKPNGEIYLTGWAADLHRDGGIEEVQIIAKGDIVQRCLPYADRPEIAAKFNNEIPLYCGWSCYLSSSQVKLYETVIIKVINTRQMSRIIEFDSLMAMIK